MKQFMPQHVRDLNSKRCLPDDLVTRNINISAYSERDLDQALYIIKHAVKSSVNAIRMYNEHDKSRKRVKLEI